MFEAILGGSVASALAGIVGGKMAASRQSKAADKAIQAQYYAQQAALAWQQGKIDEAKAFLQQAQTAAAGYQTDYLGRATDVQTNALTGSNEAQAAALSKARADLAPYMGVGQEGVNRLMAGADYLTKPITFDQAALEATPGYKFALSQGLRGQQQSATTRGLGLSGAQLKGAAEFATGLADQTYGAQFERERAQRADIFNRLTEMVGAGQGAAGQASALTAGAGADTAGRIFGTGANIGQMTFGTGQSLSANEMEIGRMIAALLGNAGAQGAGAIMGAGQNVSNALIGQGDARAGGIMAGVNAIQGGSNNLTNFATMNYMAKNYPGIFGGQRAVGMYGSAAP